MQESVFTKIIKGDLPCHKVYEDEKTLAFMTINPVFPGHVLVIPKLQIDHFDDLPEEDYQALFNTVKKIGKRIKQVFKCKRAIVSVMGFDVPHAHIHVMPCDSVREYVKRTSEQLEEIKNNTTPEPNHQELAEVAKRLAF